VEATSAGSLRLRRLRTHELSAEEVAQIRALLDAAFASDEEERFAEEDWQHALGGLHFVLDQDGTIVAHAAVVPRDLHVDRRPIRAGYVEAVATLPALQGQGFGTIVMRDVDAHIDETYELGALGTGSHHFYERLGWRTWQGPSFVRTSTGIERTPDEDGYILVLLTRSSPALDLAAPISCEWRAGDVW
jgi:aminoglycoside 2'-N-acetyltransferase I